MSARAGKKSYLKGLFILAKFNKNFSRFSILLGVFLGIVSVLLASYYSIAWTLFILISFSVTFISILALSFLKNFND